MNRTFKPGWWNSAPKFWGSLLVLSIIIAVILSWAYGAFGETVKLTPSDLPVAEYLLRKHDIFGQVIEGEITKDGETQILVCRVMVAPGNIQTVKIVLVPQNPQNFLD